MMRMEPVIVVGPDGPVPLHDVFEGRRMLIVYHFMWKKGTPHHQQCEGCTHSQAAMNSAVRAVTVHANPSEGGIAPGSRML